MATNEGNIDYISELDPLFPKGNQDFIYNGDDELRQLKDVVQKSFTGVTGAVTATHTELNQTVGLTGSAIPASWTYFGTAAPLDAGTGANNVVQLNGSAELPAVSATNLTNLPITDYFVNYTVPVNASSAEIDHLVGITGFGTAAELDVGVTEGDVVQITQAEGVPAFPALDGSLIQNIATTDTLISDIEIAQTKDGTALMYFFGTM